MAKVMIMTEVEVAQGDTVEYMPSFAHPYRSELAQVLRIIDATGDKLEEGAGGHPYWLEVDFWKDGKVDIQPATRFIYRGTAKKVVIAGT